MCKFSDWSEFKLTHKKSVISDSLFLRFMNSSITREKRQNVVFIGEVYDRKIPIQYKI